MTLNLSPLTDSREDSSSEATPVSEITTSVFMGTKPALKNWKMYGETSNEEQQDLEDKRASLSADDGENTGNFSPVPPRNFSDRSIRAVRRATPFWLQMGQALAVFLTVAWISYAAIYILALPNSIRTITSSPLTFGGILASVLAPIAMMWLCIATWQRRSDAHIYAEALREELRGLFYPNPNQSNLIGEDIRGLMKQATEMSATSRGAIKAIQRARTGLRAEIRDFAGVSQKAEFHIERLADSLSKRAEELLSLTETIEAQTDNISQKAQHGVGQWENVSAEITELGEELESIFVSGADKLKDVSETAFQRIQNMESSLLSAVDTMSGRIGDVVGSIDVTRGNLDEQANKLIVVSDSIGQGASKLETSLKGAESISSAVENMMSVMSDSLSKVEQTAGDFYSKSDVIEKKLEMRADALKDSADKLLSSTNGLQEIGDLATHKLGEALSMAISGADTIANAVRKSKDMMDRAVVEASSQIEETSKVADEKLEALMAEARANRDHLAQLIAEIENKQIQLASSTQALDERRIQISDSVDKATTQMDVVTTQMLSRTEEPLKLIMSSIDRLENHTHEMEDKLSVRVVEVQQETGKIKSLIDDIGSSMKDSIENLTTASSQITQHTTKLYGEVDVHREGLSRFVDDLTQKTKSVTADLEDRYNHIELSIQSTSDKISDLGVGFFDKGDTLVEKVSFMSDKINGYEQTLNESILSVNSKYNEVAEKVSGQIKYMTQLSEFISPEADRILSKVEHIHSSYDALKTKCFAVADGAAECLDQLGHKLESRINGLGNETKLTSDLFISVSDQMVQTLTTIKQVSEEAQDRIGQIQSGMAGRVDDLHLISDRVQMKVESLQNNLGSYAKDLSDVLQITMSDLELATEKFGATTNILDEKTNGVTSRIVEATQKYIEEGHRMSMIGEQAVHKSARIVSVIQQEADNLINSSQSSLLELQKSGDTLSIRTKEIEEYLKASAHHTRTYSDELRDQASLIARHSSDMVDCISSATEHLSLRAKEVQRASSEVIDDIESAGLRLEEGTNVLGRVARITIETVDDAVGGFIEHGSILKNTVNNLTTQIQNIKDVQAKTERETFLASAKFVIESLYSLAVDVSRHLEGDLDIRVLRTYQKGDVSAYIRHLVEIAPKMPVEKSQRKFIEDGEFRTYVLRFIRQYEELLVQAQANDYGDLLSSVFSTSDMGKLYKILCEIAGRSSRDH